MNEFEKIYQSYSGDVYRYLCRLSGDPDLAEELTAETFFRALRALHGFRGDCDVRVWLCRIAKNCWYSHLKKRRKTADVDKLAIEDPAAGVEEALLRRSEALHIHTLAHALPEPYKEVFMLRVFGELDYAQIARLFAKTESWARVTYHRAKMKLISATKEEDV